MSLTGNAEGSFKVRGKLTTLDYLMITAYGVAVKNGFDGTEEEWLEYLRGNAYDAEEAARVAESFAADAKSSATIATEQARIAESKAKTATSMAGNAEIFANAAAANIGVLNPRIEALETQMANLLYEPIALTEKAISPATAEMGQPVSTATLTWTLNKEPVRIRLDSEEITPAKSGTVTVEVGEQTGWSLAFWDERDNSVNWMPFITSCNGVYYGAAEAPEIIDSAFVLGLEKKVLSNAKGRTITVNAEDGEYIWYCLPASISKANSCVFKVGGFEGGFDLVDTTSITNSHGYAEDYCIYRSARAGLGETTVEVS